MKVNSVLKSKSKPKASLKVFSLGLGVFFVSLLVLLPVGQAANSRQKVIDFEDEYVEGVNKRPLDSVSQISEAERRRKNHLYRKRVGFRSETIETLRMVRFE